MRDREMVLKLGSGEALDVRAMGEEIEPGVFRLSHFAPGYDYCDAGKEIWMMSIGRHRRTGAVYAAKDARYEMDPEFECVWLR
jgi:hypothetical protein